jgi:DNA-binding protein
LARRFEASPSAISYGAFESVFGILKQKKIDQTKLMSSKVFKSRDFRSKYRRVPTREPLSERLGDVPSNHIYIRQRKVKLGVYVDYAERELAKCGSVKLVAMGDAIYKAVSVAELIKRKHNGALHQLNRICSRQVLDAWMPIDESSDLPRIEEASFVATMYIDLSIDALDSNDPGYQPPTDVGVHIPLPEFAIGSSSSSSSRSSRGDDRQNSRPNGFSGRFIAPVEEEQSDAVYDE